MNRLALILALLALPAAAQTAQEKAALDWCVVEGADKWLANARQVLGDASQKAISTKIAKCLPDYERASDKRPKAVRDTETAR